jgi:hypothetical protein
MHTKSWGVSCLAVAAMLLLQAVEARAQTQGSTRTPKAESSKQPSVDGPFGLKFGVPIEKLGVNKIQDLSGDGWIFGRGTNCLDRIIKTRGIKVDNAKFADPSLKIDYFKDTGLSAAKVSIKVESETYSLCVGFLEGNAFYYEIPGDQLKEGAAIKSSIDKRFGKPTEDNGAYSHLAPYSKIIWKKGAVIVTWISYSLGTMATLAGRLQKMEDFYLSYEDTSKAQTIKKRVQERFEKSATKIEPKKF